MIKCPFVNKIENTNYDMYIVKHLLLGVFLLSLSCTPANNVKNILPRDSFLKIEKQILVKHCHPQKKDYCITKNLGATASGVIVGNDGYNSYALTAAHVCVDKEAKKFLKKYKHEMRFFVININRIAFGVEVVAVDKKNDLCLLYVRGLNGPVVPLAEKQPVPGDRIYNIAAPIGIFDKNMIPIFDGFYNGDSKNISIYSLPAKGGSSGSPILNHKGELIGMVSAVFIHYPQLIMSPKFEETMCFIKREVMQDMNKRTKTTNCKIKKGD